MSGIPALANSKGVQELMIQDQPVSVKQVGLNEWVVWLSDDPDCTCGGTSLEDALSKFEAELLLSEENFGWPGR
jgi:hypothetical protein